MLPFLKNPNKMVTTLMDRRSGNSAEVSPDIETKDHPDHDPQLEAAAQSLLSAIQSKSIQGIRDALKQAFQSLEAQPHEEGEHTNPSDTPERED